jgi:transcriptional regulator with XRE-family HTH domain
VTRPVVKDASRAQSKARLGPDAFGHAVRIARTRAGLTQKDLAFTSQIGAKRISEIERGTVNPTLKTIDAMAYGLAISASDLLIEAERVATQLKRYPKHSH